LIFNHLASMTVQDVGLSFLCPDALYAVHGAVILKVFSINKESFFSDRNVSIPKIKPASDASKLVLMERCATILKIKIIR
jgi:hypothetical protein